MAENYTVSEDLPTLFSRVKQYAEEHDLTAPQVEQIFTTGLVAHQTCKPEFWAERLTAEGLPKKKVPG